jgi:hypothetical protein
VTHLPHPQGLVRRIFEEVETSKVVWPLIGQQLRMWLVWFGTAEGNVITKWCAQPCHKDPNVVREWARGIAEAIISRAMNPY